MIKGIISFKDLGRSNANGTFKVIANDEDDFNELMYKEFSKYLMSSDISFRDGKIYAGFRKVGEFEFIAEKEK